MCTSLSTVKGVPPERWGHVPVVVGRLMLTSSQHPRYNSSMAKSFGARIRDLRRSASLTQRQLAERAGLNFTYVSKIENDRLEHTPSIRAIQDLARALQVDELELMDAANKVPPLLEAIARDKDALRFFRRATQTVTSPEGWRDLFNYLERKGQPRQSKRRVKGR